MPPVVHRHVPGDRRNPTVCQGVVHVMWPAWDHSFVCIMQVLTCWVIVSLRGVWNLRGAGCAVLILILPMRRVELVIVDVVGTTPRLQSSSCLVSARVLVHV